MNFLNSMARLLEKDGTAWVGRVAGVPKTRSMFRVPFLGGLSESKLSESKHLLQNTTTWRRIPG
jgi:hypothetical protein